MMVAQFPTQNYQFVLIGTRILADVGVAVRAKFICPLVAEIPAELCVTFNYVSDLAIWPFYFFRRGATEPEENWQQ